MYLAFHGGKCCGIKTIYELGGSPDDFADYLPKINNNNADVTYATTNTTTRFFTDAAPEETKLKRLDRYLAFVKKKRPQHMVEIVLAEGTHCSQKKWVPIIEERGFKKVSEFLNSNSENVCSVYHFVYDMTKETK